MALTNDLVSFEARIDNVVRQYGRLRSSMVLRGRSWSMNHLVRGPFLYDVGGSGDGIPSSCHGGPTWSPVLWSGTSTWRLSMSSRRGPDDASADDSGDRVPFIDISGLAAWLRVRCATCVGSSPRAGFPTSRWGAWSASILPRSTSGSTDAAGRRPTGGSWPAARTGRGTSWRGHRQWSIRM